MEYEIDNKSIYNTKWSQWEDMKKYGPMSRWLRKLIIKITRGLSYESVLDVGCGEGTAILEIFKNQNKKIVGSDFSISAIEIAKKKNPDCKFFFLDLTQPRENDEKYDLVICSEVLEHVSDLDSSIDNLCRLSNKYVLITGPQGRMRPCETYVGHVRNLDLGYLKKRFERNGFDLKKMYEWGFPLFSPLYRDLQNRFSATQHKISEGAYSFWQKAICQIIYIVFFLNSYHKGDQLVVLAAKRDLAEKL